MYTERVEKLNKPSDEHSLSFTDIRTYACIVIINILGKPETERLFRETHLLHLAALLLSTAADSDFVLLRKRQRCEGGIRLQWMVHASISS